MSRCPVDYAEIENDRIMNGLPRMNRANGFKREQNELKQAVNLDEFNAFVKSLTNNVDYVYDDRTYCLHDCIALIDENHGMWIDKVRGQNVTIGDIFADDPLKLAKLFADGMIPYKYEWIIVEHIKDVARVAVDIE